MRTRDDIFTEVLVRNNRTTTDGFIDDDNLKDWYRDANIWAAGKFKWPMTLGRVETTFTTGSGPDGDEYYFEGYKADSFRIVTVGGKRLTKLNFEDYLIQREEASGDDARVFSQYGNMMRINPNADVSGTLVAYGQYQPAIDQTDETGITVFSDWNADANEAIVEKMLAYLKRREHLPEEAELHDQRALTKLAEIWKTVQDEKYAFKTTKEREGMWERVDIVEGGLHDEVFNRDQF